MDSTRKTKRFGTDTSRAGTFEEDTPKTGTSNLLHCKPDPLAVWRADGSGPFVPPEVRKVDDCVLLFEGGGMRASYTCAAVVTLLEQGICFPYVCGVSAGSSNTVNYLSGDPWRAHVSFTDIVLDPHFGGAKTFVQGKGYFSAQWIYQEAGLASGVIPFGFDRFLQHPADFGIQGFNARTGETVVWGRSDIHTLDELMLRVRASSTLPFVMPPVQLDGATFFDGGMGEGAGIGLQMALDAGYDRIFAVLTRPKGFRKKKTSLAQHALALAYRPAYPHLAESILTRNRRYNAELDRLESLAASGRVYIVYADDMRVSNSTGTIDDLRKSYNAGYAQYQRELPAWLEWLGV